MMPQMEPGDRMHEQSSSPYGRYEGERQQQYEIPPYNASTSQSGQTYDDDFIELLAQRISQRMTQGPAGKIQPSSRGKANAGERLALAIVSLILLVPIAGILMAGVGGVGGLIGFGIACLTVFLVNAVFSERG